VHGVSWGLITGISTTTHPTLCNSYSSPESTHCPDRRN